MATPAPIDLGSVYDQNGLKEKAEKEYDKALRHDGYATRTPCARPRTPSSA